MGSGAVGDILINPADPVVATSALDENKKAAPLGTAFKLVRCVNQYGDRQTRRTLPLTMKVLSDAR